MSPETVVMRFLATDGEGSYYLDGLRTGSCKLTIERSGFKSKKMNDVSLIVNQAAVLDVNLEIGSSTEQLTVRGITPLVETATPQVSSVVTTTGLSALPFNGRGRVSANRAANWCSTVNQWRNQSLERPSNSVRSEVPTLRASVVTTKRL